METENRDSRRERFRSTRSGRSFAGLVLVIVGGVLLSRQLGLDVPEWAITWEMLLIAMGVYFGARRSFQPGGWVVMVLVGTVFLLRDFYPEILIWHYIWPVFIILAGLWMILKPKREYRGWKWDDNKWNESTSGDSRVDANSVFGGTKKKIMSKDFKGGEINSVFGGNDLDLTQADIIGTAVLNVNVAFGGVKLIVPPHWKVQSDIDCAFGSVEDKRKDSAEISEKTLVLKGSVIFGGIEIKSY